MNPAPSREVGEPPRRRRSWMRAATVGALLLGAAVVGGVLVLREPRFNGRTVGELVDSLGAPEPTRMRSQFHGHPIRKAFEGSEVALLSAVERELERSARTLRMVRERHGLKLRWWGEMARLQLSALNPSPPVRDAVTEHAANAHLVWSTALVLELSSNLVAGLGQFEAVVDEITAATAIEASAGFRAVTDADGSLTAALKGRLQSATADPALRPVWLSCLGHLGAQASSAAGQVRALTGDPDRAVRFEAIKALGTLDSRLDTAEFLRGCAKDTEGRQAALLALAQMQERARPVEAFIRDAIHDPDMLTGLFAKFALEAMERAPARPDPSGQGQGVP